MMTRIPSAALLWTFLLLPYLNAAAEPVHIPLSRRSRAQLDPHVEVHKLKLKYGLVSPNSIAPTRRASRPGKRASSAGMSIVNQGGASFLGTVNIGTPPQPFSVVLDTGSSDLWVANTQCAKCPGNQPVFDATKSTTFQSSSTLSALAGQVSIQYGQGQVSGSLVSDTVSMGSFNIPSQTFLSVNDVSDDLSQSATQGIMGLAFAPLANTHAIPFWQALATANGVLSTPEMAFWLQRTDPQTPDEIDAGGIFTLGGVNNSLFTGNIEFLDMPSTPQGPAFWVLNVETITVNGNNVPITTAGGASLAAIDTGTTLLGAPSDAAAAIWKVVGGTPLNDGSGLFEFPCDTKVAVTISFGGQAWSINSQDIIFNQVSAHSRLCTGAIFDVQAGTNIQSDPGSGNPVWIVGDTFLKNVYSVFRASPPSIGFAQLSSLAGGNGAPSTSTGGSSDQTSPGTSGTGTGGNNGAGMTSTNQLVLPVSLLCAAALLLL